MKSARANAFKATGRKSPGQRTCLKPFACASLIAAMTHRSFCWTCRQPGSACYCGDLRPFDPKIEFVILIHKLESRRRIATGRMSHLCLKGSHLIEGDQFDENKQVNALLDRDDVFPVVLYPGTGSIDLSLGSKQELASQFLSDRKLMIFVIDGTWATARRTMRLSRRLAGLKRVCFSPSKVSQFKVRKQPAAHCLSTLEAIHQMIELVGPTQGFDPLEKKQDALVDVFSKMVERQLAFVPEAHKAQNYFVASSENALK